MPEMDTSADASAEIVTAEEEVTDMQDVESYVHGLIAASWSDEDILTHMQEYGWDEESLATVFAKDALTMTEQHDSVCPHCNHAVAWGATTCPACGGQVGHGWGGTADAMNVGWSVGTHHAPEHPSMGPPQHQGTDTTSPVEQEHAPEQLSMGPPQQPTAEQARACPTCGRGLTSGQSPCPTCGRDIDW